MKKTILIIDDDAVLQKALTIGLKREGFEAFSAGSAESAKEILKLITPDAIVLDRMMEGQDGLSFLKDLRASGNTTPVIMLTAMSGTDNTIAGLSTGADDYLPKPFVLKELALRLQNILNRQTVYEQESMPNGLIFKDSEFFTESCDGKLSPFALSNEEKALLQSLTSPIGNIVSATPMVAKRLRGKLNDVSLNITLLTVRGRGYKLVQTVQTNGD